MDEEMNAFNVAKYKSLLNTTYLGRNVVYEPSMDSTQTFLQSNFSKFAKGTAVIADTQTGGKGRGSNIWESHKGSLLFSFHSVVSNGMLLPFFQYLVSLALVKSIREKYPFHVPIAMKWPNDIYYYDNSNEKDVKSMKIGGVLCQSEYHNKEFHVITGVGFNVFNEKPTISLQQIFDTVSPDTKISKEEILSDFMNNFEDMLDKLIEEQSFVSFYDEYVKYWMHSNQKVVLEEENITVKIVGLTESGFLKAEDDKGEFLELHPDGNSFDFLKGLIRKKN